MKEGNRFCNYMKEGICLCSPADVRLEAGGEGGNGGRGQIVGAGGGLGAGGGRGG